MAFSTHDIVSDSPTNNFCTLNPLFPTRAPVYSEGNTVITSTIDNNNRFSYGTHGVLSGKWYFEASTSQDGYNGNCIFGVIDVNRITSSDTWCNEEWGWAIDNNGYGTIYKRHDSTLIDLGSRSSTSVIFGCAIDLDNNEIYFSINGTWIESSNPDTNTNPAYSDLAGCISPAALVYSISSGNDVVRLNFGQDPSFAGAESPTTTYTDANGIGAFYYQPPTDALALCTANLPDFTPDVDNDTPQDYFKAVLYTGNGGTQSITGVGFQPDLVWVKNRTTTGVNHRLFDSVRGPASNLYSSLSDAAANDPTGLTSFDSGGFSIGATSVNDNNDDFVAWCFKAGGAPTADNTATSGAMNANGSAATSSNSSVSLNGTLQSNYTPAGSPTIYPTRMSINTDAGFSIVKYTGTGANATVPHGLSSAPEVIIVKNLSNSYDWNIYNTTLGGSGGLYFTSVAAVTGYNLFWNGTNPTTNIFSLGTNSNVNRSGDNYIAYCWHSVEGYSKIGSYVANGSADGPFIYCGFRPAFVMIKRTDSTGSWFILDNARDEYNVANHQLFPNSSAMESTSIGVLDFLSNGFKVRYAYISGSTYIFMAFAEQPFKYANAR